MKQCNEGDDTQAFTSLIFDIYRGTSHDGPGLRTTIFFKGCPLRCTWCQNPEGVNGGQELWWDERKCIGCLLCNEACESGANIPGDNGIHIDRSKCSICGACIKACPSKAMSFTGQEYTIEQLVCESLKDWDYFQSFGGGVTASGGEPLMQYKFVAELFKQLKNRGVNTALDTSGFAPKAAVQAVLPFADCILYDLKIMSSKRHQYFTGRPNELVLENVCDIAEYIRKQNRIMKLWIRTPLIPEVTAIGENISQIAQFIKDKLYDVVERWELCAFNSMSVAKYKKMGMDWAFQDVKSMDETTIERLKSYALSNGFASDKLIVSGFVSKGED